MKVVIQDLVAQSKGESEQVLLDKTTIRFEINGVSLSCTPTEKGLEIMKMGGSMGSEGRLVVNPASSNVIYVK